MRYEKKPLPGGSSGNSSMPRPATARPLRLLSLVLLGTLLALPPAAAQHRQVSVAFYNVENLFDTIASPLHADGDFTPSGRYGWDTERYRTKLDRIARTIDDAGFDVVALAEVESERAVRDLAETLHDDYSFIYRSTSDRRSISLALLYKGDKFFPGEISRIASGTSREFLYVQGELIGYPTGLLVCHLPSKFNDRKYRIRAAARLAEVADSLLVRAECSRLLVLGDFNGELDEEPFRRAFGPERDGHLAGGRLRNALWEHARNGFGSYCWEGEWLLYDNLLVSAPPAEGDGLHLRQAGIFVRDYLLTGHDGEVSHRTRRGYPFRTFSGNRYLGGYSDHLPVYVILSR